MTSEKLKNGHSLAACKERELSGYSCFRRDTRQEADGELHLNEEVSQML